jgi:hypothetical protein
MFEAIFLVSPQLNNDAILGCQFLREHGVSINFSSETFEYVRNGVTRARAFAPKAKLQNVCSNDDVEVPEPNYRECKSADQLPLAPPAGGDDPLSLSKAADCCKDPLNTHPEIGSEETYSVRHGLRIEKGQLDPARNQEFPDLDPQECQLISRGECVPARVADSPRSSVAASLSAQPPPELETNSVETVLLHDQPILNPETHSPDSRSLQVADLRSLVEQVDGVSTDERDALYQVLLRYRVHMTTRPGKCKLFTYRFQVEADNPIVGYSRPIPYALRPAVREQIKQMLEDGIIENSSSPFLSPLIVVRKRSGDIRICVVISICEDHKATLGGTDLESVVSYVDDILIRSPRGNSRTRDFNARHREVNSKFEINYLENKHRISQDHSL